MAVKAVESKRLAVSFLRRDVDGVQRVVSTESDLESIGGLQLERRRLRNFNVARGDHISHQ